MFVVPLRGGHAAGRVRVRLLCPPYGTHARFVGWAKARPSRRAHHFRRTTSHDGHATGRVRVRLLCLPYGTHARFVGWAKARPSRRAHHVLRTTSWWARHRTHSRRTALPTLRDSR